MKNRQTIKGLALSTSALVLSAGAGFAAQVFTTDLIVEGSACVGIDCVASESFGFDTLRLKENNLRIHFEDTSSSGSFPSNDWRIIINDSGNGGANFFAVQDATSNRTPFKIEANAPANSLYVEDDGDVGIKTASPVVDLHIVEGNTPTLRLEQDGSDGFSPQTFDVAANEVNFFVRDVTNGSKLPFRIRPGAPDSAIDIAADGDIGIGTESPTADLHIRTADGTSTVLTLDNDSAGIEAEWDLVVRAADGQFAINDDRVAGAEFIFSGPNATVPGLAIRGGLTATAAIEGDTLTCTGTANACVFETSDLRMKSNVRDLENAAEVVRKLRPISWQTDGTAINTGFGAQDVEAVMKEAGFEDWAGHKYLQDKDRHVISYTAMIGFLVGAHHEKDLRIHELETMIETLSAKVDNL